MNGGQPDVLVVGAGLSGLVAARQLATAGVEVVVLDRGASVGGRLATRRIGDARLDHGAQFFTVRGDDFASVVREAEEAGIVQEWCRGFDDPPDGFPRYAGVGGMNAVTKWLARGVDVRTGIDITSVEITDGRVTVHSGTSAFTAQTALLTPPAPQSLSLLDAGGVRLSSSVDEKLRSLEYFSTLALMVALDGPPAIAAPGGIQMSEEEPFTFIGDNQAKGTSHSSAVTFHANHSYSARRIDDHGDDVLADLMTLARPWLGDARVMAAQLKKWKYAGPVAVLAERVLVDRVAGASLAFAGDAFGGPKVEGAFNSGMAAGRLLLES